MEGIEQLPKQEITPLKVTTDEKNAIMITPVEFPRTVREWRWELDGENVKYWKLEFNANLILSSSCCHYSSVLSDIIPPIVEDFRDIRKLLRSLWPCFSQPWVLSIPGEIARTS